MNGFGGELRRVFLRAVVGGEPDARAPGDEFVGERRSRKKMAAGAAGGDQDQIVAFHQAACPSSGRR